MILPHPESDLSTNILVLGADIITMLKGKSYLFIEDLLNDFLKKNKKRTPDMFFHTIIFLYIFDLIEQKGFKVNLKNTKWKKTIY